MELEEREKLISQLKTLLEKIKRVDSAESHFARVSAQVDSTMARRLTRVDDFDRANKGKYIEAKIGLPPEEPSSLLILALPIYLARKKDYDQKHAEYEENYKTAEAQYYSEFAERRNKMESDEQAEIAYAIQDAEKAKAEAAAERVAARAELNADTMFSDRLKTRKTVSRMIEYVQDQRADSLKEAVNLYFEEQHRQKLESFAKKQVRLTKEAKEYARQAAESASEAADRASEAISDAREALERADAAYGRADEAYGEAQNAYLQAQNS